MHSLGTFLSSNAAFVSVANVGGVLGLIVMAYAFAKRSVKFLRTVWVKNVAVALEIIRSERRLQDKRCADDPVIFIATLSRDAFFMLVMLTVNVGVLITMSGSLLKGVDEIDKWTPWGLKLVPLMAAIYAFLAVGAGFNAANRARRVLHLRLGDAGDVQSRVVDRA